MPGAVDALCPDLSYAACSPTSYTKVLQANALTAPNAYLKAFVQSASRQCDSGMFDFHCEGPGRSGLSNEHKEAKSCQLHKQILCVM